MSSAITQELILVGHDVHEATETEWREWRRTVPESARRVDWTDLGEHGCVSTVFLLSCADRSRCFETMTRGGPLAEEFDWYATWAEAEQGHARMVARVLQRATLCAGDMS